MKLRRRPIPLVLLLLQLAPIALVAADAHLAGSARQLSRREEPQLGPDPKSPTNLLDKPPTVIANQDAPVDGKDGRPHQGPFVETSAERDRKKAKETGETELSAAAYKAPPKDAIAGAALADGWGASMPESNDGVMDDPGREGPREGTRGTEGGISEKSKDRKTQVGTEGVLDGLKIEKTPEAPKEAPPLLDSEHGVLVTSERESSKADGGSAKAEDDHSTLKTIPNPEELGGLKKPSDLPEKPHDLPHPVPAGTSKDPLEIAKPVTPSTDTRPSDTQSLIQPLHSFLLSFTMIIFSEIGDKTFLIAALMAMKYPALFVFSAAFPALLVMTVLSALLGHTVPALISEKFTEFAAAILFLFFGVKMIREGLAISPDEGVDEEMKEVEQELEEKEHMARKMGRRSSLSTPYMLESGRGSRKSRSNSRLPAPPDSPPSSPDSRSPSPSRSSMLANVLTGLHNLFSLLLSPAWVQTFVMTFLGEWGDRSQIATIAMSAGQDYWWVTGGALVGHALCTLVACFGGRAIAGRVSLRIVTLGGAIAFLAFGFIYLAEAFYSK